MLNDSGSHNMAYIRTFTFDKPTIVEVRQAWWAYRFEKIARWITTIPYCLTGRMSWGEFKSGARLSWANNFCVKYGMRILSVRTA